MCNILLSFFFKFFDNIDVVILFVVWSIGGVGRIIGKLVICRIWYRFLGRWCFRGWILVDRKLSLLFIFGLF